MMSSSSSPAAPSSSTAFTPLQLAWLGTGAMGLPMAQRLCAAGHRVHVWNRTTARAEPLREAGAVLHTQAADAVRAADVVVGMLENGPVVNPTGRTDVVTNQQQVDDLLASLGF